MTKYKSAVELADSLEYDGGELGFKDLKDGGLRNVIIGMADAYMSIQDADETFIPGSGSQTLDLILDELRSEAHDAILRSLYMDIQATLTNFLDAEAGE